MPSHMHRWISNLGPQSRHCLDATRLSNTRAAPSPKCSPEFIGEGSSAAEGCIVACGLKSCDHHPPTVGHQSQRRNSLPISPCSPGQASCSSCSWKKGGKFPVGPTAVPESIFPTPSPYVTLGQFQEQKPPWQQVFPSISVRRRRINQSSVVVLHPREPHSPFQVFFERRREKRGNFGTGALEFAFATWTRYPPTGATDRHTRPVCLDIPSPARPAVRVSPRPPEPPIAQTKHPKHLDLPRPALRLQRSTRFSKLN